MSTIASDFSWLQSIVEALKPSEYRNIVKGWDKSKYDRLFKSQPYEKDRNAYRFFIPLDFSVKANASVVKPSIKVVKALESKGYVIKDYTAGLAIEKNGKRIMKIGKLLNDNPSVQKLFVNDPARATSRVQTKEKLMVVVSRHPYDIAGMSTDRGWTSCMNLKDGVNRKYVPIDVKEGTIIAYLIRESDRNIESAMGRVLIKPYVNIETLSTKEEDVVFGIGKVYGINTGGFVETVTRWVDSVNDSKKLSGIFIFDPKLYGDGVANIKVLDSSLTQKQIKTIQSKPESILKMNSKPPDPLILIAVDLSSFVPKHIPDSWVTQDNVKKIATVLKTKVEQSNVMKDLKAETLRKFIEKYKSKMTISDYNYFDNYLTIHNDFR